MAEQGSRRSFRIAELVERFGGSFGGNPDREVRSFATLEHAGPDQLAFFTNPRYRHYLTGSRAAAILIGAAQAQAAAQSDDAALADRLWVVDDPYLRFSRIAQFFYDANRAVEPAGIHPSAVVDRSAQIHPSSTIGAHAAIGARAEIGERVVIGPGCVVGDDASLGADTRLYANVTVYSDCAIGVRGIVHSGAVIGADGFGFAKDGASWVKIPQTGRVVIGDDVEIGANTTIDRGALEDTVIGDGVKLDNQIQIGHNVRIGDDTAIAGCVAIAGSTVIGKRCTIAGKSSVVGHLVLADDVHISASTMVTHSLHKPGRYTGAYPFSDHQSWEKNAAVLRNLGTLRQRVRALENERGIDPEKEPKTEREPFEPKREQQITDKESP